jgi:very-short-patch-repair endonuclease
MKTQKKDQARLLRHEATATERLLWKELRNRKLAGAKFRRQQCLGPYILDFYCADKKLCIELDGGQHDTPERRHRDEIRSAFLEREGIRTVRFWNSQVREDIENVLRRIRAELVAPSPCPSPRSCGERVGVRGNEESQRKIQKNMKNQQARRVPEIECML